MNLLVGITLAVYNVVLLNFIVFFSPVRFDLTEEGLHSLSPESRAQLKRVDRKIHVVLCYYLQPGNAQHYAYARVLERGLMLLKEYHAEQPFIEVVAEVNAFRQPDRWKSLCEEHDLNPTGDINRLVFVGGGRKRSLTAKDLAVFLPARDKNFPPQVKQFRGERAITGAIVRLVQDDRKMVYFTRGHGELALAPKKDQAPALSALRHDLESSGYLSAELSLSKVRRVPEDCSLLVIAGPEQRFTEEELSLIEKYLMNDGRLFVSLGSRRTGLEDVLERWGILAQEGRIRMRILLPGLRTERDWVAAVGYNPEHPVTEPFRNTANFQMNLWLPRPLRVTGGQVTMRTQPLLRTGADNENERFVWRDPAGAPPNSDQRRGDFILAVAVAAEKVDRPPPDWNPRKTRIVVVASSNFLRDVEEHATVQGGYLSYYHRDFFMNCARWLTGDEELLSLGGHVSTTRQLPSGDASLWRFLFVASIVVFPGVFFLLGVGVYFLRRT
ncbi:MAG: GldG family protein [Planctomycetota bacterium]|nr:GldG family protein [Planctomycetota bacterium]